MVSSRHGNTLRSGYDSRDREGHLAVRGEACTDRVWTERGREGLRAEWREEDVRSRNLS